jgi:phage terminase large subunit
MTEQKKIPLKTTIHFEQLQNSTKRISVFQGGTRSAKTYNILIWIIIYLCQTQGKIVTICRETLPSLRGTAMRDFFEILDKYANRDLFEKVGKLWTAKFEVK